MALSRNSEKPYISDPKEKISSSLMVAAVPTTRSAAMCLLPFEKLSAQKSFLCAGDCASAILPRTTHYHPEPFKKW
jgi:hypothetical protein